MQHFCDPMDYSLPGSPVHRIFQASTLGCCPWPGESGTWLMTPVSCQWGTKQLLVYPSLAFALCPSLVHALDTRIKKKKEYWVALSYSRGSSWPRDRTLISYISRWILCNLRACSFPALCFQTCHSFTGNHLQQRKQQGSEGKALNSSSGSASS